MIRKIVESDRNSLLEYLNEKESLNIIINANVQIWGLEGDRLTFYGEFDENNNYLSVLLLFTNGVVVFCSNKKLFNKEWLVFLNDHEVSYITGVEDVIKKISPYYKEYKASPTYFCGATKLTSRFEDSNYEIFKVTTVKQCEKLYNLLKTIDGLAAGKEDKQLFIKRRMESLTMGNTFYIEENGIMISTAAVIAETNSTAIVNSVGTDLQHRNRGLATVLMKHIMNEYIEDKHKRLYLSYDNPKAGNIYKRLGFTEVGRWTMLSKK